MLSVVNNFPFSVYINALGEPLVTDVICADPVPWEPRDTAMV